MLSAISGEERMSSVNIRCLLQISDVLFTTERVGNLGLQIILLKGEAKVNNRWGYFRRSDNCMISSYCVFHFFLKSIHEKEFSPFPARHHSWASNMTFRSKYDMMYCLLPCGVHVFHDKIIHDILEGHSCHNLEVKQSQIEITFLSFEIISTVLKQYLLHWMLEKDYN